MTTKIDGTLGVDLIKDGTVKAADFDPNLFLANKTGYGYQKLPSGLIIQWGNNDTSAGSVTATFPIPFPTAVFQVVAVCAITAATIAVVADQTQNNCTLYSHNGAGTAVSTPVHWIAIGY